MESPLQLRISVMMPSAGPVWLSVYSPNETFPGLPMRQPFLPRICASAGSAVKNARATARAALVRGDVTGQISQFERRRTFLRDVDVDAALAVGERRGEVVAACFDLVDFETAVAPGPKLELIRALAAQE